VIIDRGEIVANFQKSEVSLHELDEFLLQYATGKEKHA